jgi:plastocyanin
MKHLRLTVALGLVATGGLLVACSSGSDATPSPTTTEAPTATSVATDVASSTPTGTEGATATTEATSTATGQAVQAPIASFTLPSLTVSVGTTVTWSNQDGVGHTATAADGEFDSGTITDGTYSHTFEAAGTFAYACLIHPSMTGEIVVQ